MIEESVKSDYEKTPSQSEFYTAMKSSWAGDKTFASGSRQVYLDHNATTSPAPFYRDKIADWVQIWGNPSSIHWGGRDSKALIRTARKNVAGLVSAKPLEVVFTGGGSESNNLALKGVLEYMLEKENLTDVRLLKRNRWITSEVEHPSVLQVFESFRKKGLDVQYVKIDRSGQIDMDHYKSLLNEKTALVSLMLANNETGALLPIKRLAHHAHSVGALFHTDAVQALGKISINLKELDVDLASFSGHKFYAFKGIGFLYCKSGVQLRRQIEGGGQERHRRSGTENLLSICSLSEVAGWKNHVLEMSESTRKMRDQMERCILDRIEGVQVNGNGGSRLPNTMNLTISGVDGESLLMNLDLKGFAVSTGAACSAGSPEPSHALLSMGLSREEAQSSLRVSLGWGTHPDHIERFVDALQAVVERLRKISQEKIQETLH